MNLTSIPTLATEFPLYPTAGLIMFLIFLWGLARLLSQGSRESDDNNVSYEAADPGDDDEPEDDDED